MLIVATIFMLFIAGGGFACMHWPWISAWFEFLPSDETSFHAERRYEQVWIQKYLPSHATILQVEGTPATSINIQKKLVDRQKHIVLNTNENVLQHVHASHKIHGAFATTGNPVTMTERGYAVTDYHGNIREETETWSHHTLQQLNTLYGLDINALVFECNVCAKRYIQDLASTGDLKKIVFLMIREGENQTDIDTTLSLNQLKKVQEYAGSSVWVFDPTSEHRLDIRADKSSDVRK